MFNRQSLHIAMLVWGLIFCLIAVICMVMSTNFDRKKRRGMIAMQLCTAVLLGSDALAWGFRGYPGEFGFYMVRVSNFSVFLLSDLILALFHGYLCCHLTEDDRRKSKVAVRTVYVIAGIAMILVVLSQFTNWYYYFDASNFYHRNRWHFISLLLPLGGTAVDLFLLIRYRAKLSREMVVSLFSYIILPVLMMLVQIFYYGISLTNIGICISMILLFVTTMVEQNRELAKAEKEAADLRISLLLSQIAPHFVYNALTTIQRLCVKDPETAQQTIADFSAYLRGNLDALERKEPIPFTQELEHTKRYLSIEKKRFGDRVNVCYDIHDTNFVIPALTLQVLVENAVKHGVCRKPDGGTVTITTERKQKTIYIIVTDDGVGFKREEMGKKGKSHVGLKNAEARLANLCGGKLDIRSEIGKGTVAVITLPQRG